MEALQFRYELFRYLTSRLAFRVARRLWSARRCPLHQVRLNPPVPARPGWTSLRVHASGICGSDLNMVTGQESLFLAPEATYPFIPGHEVVGHVERPVSGLRDGRRVDLEPGDRVALWPVLGCAARELAPPCEPCASGWAGLCQRRHDGWPGPGVAIGFNRDTGGGWSETCLAHASQLWKLPDSVDDRDAVVLDPASAALAALLRTAGDVPGQTLVIGGGTIGLLTAWLHQQLRLAGSCELLVRHEFQRAWAVEHGLSAAVVRREADFSSWAKEHAIPAEHVAGYGWVYRGRFDRVIEVAGSRSALTWALRAVKPRGVVALVTAAVDWRGIDPTPIWYRELALHGISEYGPVPWQGRPVHPYEVMLPRLADGSLRLRDVITHTFPLSEYVAALRVALHRRRSRAIKVTFRPADATSP
jgi:threonine dehydrogenase-like Zn-dependent dehydrogenase